MPNTRNSELAIRNPLPAIDVLFQPSARAGAACPRVPPTASEMDQAGIAKALVSQCKKWSCERQWMCVDTRLEDVLRYTDSSSRFVGLAGYNPFDIPESLREIEFAFTTHAFRGVYLHAASFNLPLTDARMYPLFAKAAELSIPVLMQLPAVEDLAGTVARVSDDFPDLPLVVAQSRPELVDLSTIPERCDNVYFALDPGALSYLTSHWSELAVEHEEFCRNFLAQVLQQRCMWGSSGVSWPEAVYAADFLLMLPETRDAFLSRNAERVFALGQPLATSRTPRSAEKEILAAER